MGNSLCIPLGVRGCMVGLSFPASAWPLQESPQPVSRAMLEDLFLCPYHRLLCPHWSTRSHRLPLKWDTHTQAHKTLIKNDTWWAVFAPSFQVCKMVILMQYSSITIYLTMKKSIQTNYQIFWKISIFSISMHSDPYMLNHGSTYYTKLSWIYGLNVSCRKRQKTTAR